MSVAMWPGGRFSRAGLPGGRRPRRPRTLEASGLITAGQGSPLEDRWSLLIDDLLAIRLLEHDWDGQGAAAPSHPIVDAAIRLAQKFSSMNEPVADRIVAGINGTVVFEWHDARGYHEIEVARPDGAEYSWVRPGADRAEVALLRLT